MAFRARYCPARGAPHTRVVLRLVLFLIAGACADEPQPPASRLPRIAAQAHASEASLRQLTDYHQVAEREGDPIAVLDALDLLAQRLEGDDGCAAARYLTEHASQTSSIRERAVAATRACTEGPPPDCTLERLSLLGESDHGGRAVASLSEACSANLPEAAVSADRVSLPLRSIAVGPDFPREFTHARGGLQRVTVADGSLTFHLQAGAHASTFVLESPPRLIIDISLERSAEIPSAQQQALGPLVMIDPGHGGNEYGARYQGLKESELVLDLAERTVAALRSRIPNVRIMMTRQTDEVVSLEQRTAMANAVRADLFVSIHLNAADEPVETGGITTFVLDAGDQAQEVRLAARENGTDPEAVTGIQRLIARVYRREQVSQSRILAQAVHEETLAGGRRILPGLPDRGVRSAMFYVLVGARMPAILLEASFMTKDEEAAALRTPRYRQSISEGIARGIENYLRNPDSN